MMSALAGIQAPAAIPIDIEELVQWTMQQTGYLPWCGVTDRVLAFDHGYTVLPRKAVCDFRGGKRLLRRAVPDDAAIVIEAIKGLDPAVAAMVIACGRGRIRPNWMPGIEPRRTTKFMYGKRKNKRRGRKASVVVWEPCDPAVIRAVRQAYECWHRGLQEVAAAVQGRITGFAIKGLSAPLRPWEPYAENTA